MTAREKFKIGDKVQMGRSNPWCYHQKPSKRFGIVKGFPKDKRRGPYIALILWDGHISGWHMDFWRVCREAKHG